MAHDDDYEDDQASGPDFEDLDEDGDDAAPNAFTPMHFDTLSRKVKDLLSDYASGDLDPNPSFQRGYVWDRSRASKLIESILLNVPLPLVYTAEEKNRKEVVIDGQQRLLSVFGFIRNEFPRDKSPFRLSSLKLINELNKKSFKELSPEQQRAIQQYKFQLITISSESHADVKFEIFERLNSGSVTLNAQELRNCVYRGTFNEVLRELADISDFRALLGTATALGRMQDVEMVLRFIAFYERTYLNFPGGMKTFLNSFMNDHRNVSEEKADGFRRAFKKACSLSLTVFGDKAFRKYRVGIEGMPDGRWENQINKPLYDVVMWSFTRFEPHQITPRADAIRDRMIRLLSTNVRFVDAITAAVADKGKVKYRFETWLSALEDVVTDPEPKRLFPSEQRREMFDKYPVCGICGQQISHLDDAQVDHIKPYSAGGKTDAANAQLAHRFCNASKSDHQGQQTPAC